MRNARSADIQVPFQRPSPREPHPLKFTLSSEGGPTYKVFPTRTHWQPHVTAIPNSELPAPRISKFLQRRTRRLIICSTTPAPPARRRPSCAPRLGWQPQQLAPLGCKVHGGAALVTTAPTLREHRRARMHDVQHAPALRPVSAVSSACNGAARGPRARHARRGGDHALHARRGGDHAPRAFTQAHDGGCSGGARVQAPRCERLRTAR